MMALIPAAGHSRRMGRPKLSLPLGGRSILETTIHALKSAGAADVLVIVAPHVAELAPLARQGGAHVLELPQATPHMRATVEAGLTWLESRLHPAPNEPWLLVPADHPVLEAAVVRRLLDAFGRQLHQTLAVPTFRGRRGHPAVITWKHVAGIRACPPDLGLNAYLRQHMGETLEVSVNSDSILLDLDTPEDYVNLLQRASSAANADN